MFRVRNYSERHFSFVNSFACREQQKHREHLNIVSYSASRPDTMGIMTSNMDWTTISNRRIARSKISNLIIMAILN